MNIVTTKTIGNRRPGDRGGGSRFGPVTAGLATTGLVLLLWSAVPAAADQPSSKLCTDPKLATPEIVACLEKAAKAADAKLNAAYRKAVGMIDADPDRTADQKTRWKAELAAAQRAWIAFRDADCGDLTLTEWNSGSGSGGAIEACLYDKTVQRTDDLVSRYPLH